MKSKNRCVNVVGAFATAATLGSLVAPGTVLAEGESSVAPSDFRLSGYLRTWASVNLKDNVETAQNDKGDLSMLRGSLSLNADLKTGPVQWKAIARLDREARTSYSRRLDALTRQNTPGGPGSDSLATYNQAELREFYADFDLAERVHMRLGKQQVAWGETDFFHATDLTQGYDFRWRSFLERDNDEIRKPLILLNAMLKVPEADGSLQVLIRPGFNRDRDNGNSFDVTGGRWAQQPFRGVDFLAPGNLTYDYRHPDGSTNDVTGGLRWTGTAGTLSYALSYLKTFNPNPIVNSAFVPYKSQPHGGIGDFIFPKLDVYGASVTSELPSVDGVFSAEVALQKDRPFNVGSNFFNGALPGFGGVLKKNVVVSSLRFDKSFRLMELLGTNAPSFSSIQLFNTSILRFKSADDLVEQAGFGAPVRKSTTLLTGFIGLNYQYSSINPGLAVGADVTNGDAFLIPSIEFKWGNHWRLVAEADLFFPQHQKRPGEVETRTHPLGTLANSDQFLLRLSYQF